MAKYLEAYLVLKPKGYSSLSARLTSKSPSLESDEVAVSLNVSVPDALFKRPQLSANIMIPDSAAGKPSISADVLDNVQKVLAQQTGLDIKVSLIEPTQLA